MSDLMSSASAPTVEQDHQVLAASAEAAATAKIGENVEVKLAPIRRYAYPYAKLTGLGANLMAYTGTPVELVDDEPTPDGASPWAPPVTPEGLVAYHDGVGWCVGADLSKATLAELQSWMLRDLAIDFQHQVDGLTSAYTPAEQKSWAQQLAAAAIVVNGNGEPSPLLQALADARSIDVKVLAQKIVDKDAEYQKEYATLLGAYQAQRDKVSGAKTVADLPPVTLDAIRVMIPSLA